MTLKAFRKIQISNVEDTPGTAEVATELACGTMTFEDGKTLHQPEEDKGTLARHLSDDLFVGEESHLVWTGDLNFRHAAWWLCMSIRGNITPTQPDNTNQPNAYLWTLAPGLTTANTPDIANGIDTFTFEYGDNSQAYETEYCFATQVVIQGAPNQTITRTINITGRQQTDTSFTGALTAQAVQRAPFNLAKFYIDTSGANLGNTQKTGMLKAFTWTLDTMFRAHYTSDGSLFFTNVVEDRKSPELQLTYAWGSDADAERTKYEARTTTFARLEMLGATELDVGQSNPPSLILDQAIRYRAWPTWGDLDGLSTVQVMADVVYDATWGKMFEAALLTDLAAFP